MCVPSRLPRRDLLVFTSALLVLFMSYLSVAIDSSEYLRARRSKKERWNRWISDLKVDSRGVGGSYFSRCII